MSTIYECQSRVWLDTIKKVKIIQMLLDAHLVHRYDSVWINKIHIEALTS